LTLCRRGRTTLLRLNAESQKEGVQMDKSTIEDSLAKALEKTTRDQSRDKPAANRVRASRIRSDSCRRIGKAVPASSQRIKTAHWYKQTCSRRRSQGWRSELPSTHCQRQLSPIRPGFAPGRQKRFRDKYGDKNVTNVLSKDRLWRWRLQHEPEPTMARNETGPYPDIIARYLQIASRGRSRRPIG